MGTVMASLLSPRRDRGDIDLAATEPTLVVGSADSDQLPTVAWLALAAGAGLLSALCGWVLVTGLVVAGWLAAEPGTLGQALTVGTELWLLANGGGAAIGAVSVTLIRGASPCWWPGYLPHGGVRRPAREPGVADRDADGPRRHDALLPRTAAGGRCWWVVRWPRWDPAR